MADALDSKSSDRKVVGVQVPPPVLSIPFWECAVCALASALCRACVKTRRLDRSRLGPLIGRIVPFLSCLSLMGLSDRSFEIGVGDIPYPTAGPNMVDFSSFQSQMMMLAGLVLLGWVLIRHQVRSRKRRHTQDMSDRELRRQLSKADQSNGMPLATAPPETQRWQVEMFDLQRELKAELDTKIVVVQSLIRQADERIAALRAQANRPS